MKKILLTILLLTASFAFSNVREDILPIKINVSMPEEDHYARFNKVVLKVIEDRAFVEFSDDAAIVLDVSYQKIDDKFISTFKLIDGDDTYSSVEKYCFRENMLKHKNVSSQLDTVLYYVEEHSFIKGSNERYEISDLDKELDVKIGFSFNSSFGYVDDYFMGYNLGFFRNFNKGNKNFYAGAKIDNQFSFNNDKLNSYLAVIPELGYDFGTNKFVYWTWGIGLWTVFDKDSVMEFGVLPVLTTGVTVKWFYADFSYSVLFGAGVSVGLFF